MDGRVEWMRLLCLAVYMYNYVYMCDFQFKIGVKLKWGMCGSPGTL
jgi:hypothetical protein